MGCFRHCCQCPVVHIWWGVYVIARNADLIGEITGIAVSLKLVDVSLVGRWKKAAYKTPASGGTTSSGSQMSGAIGVSAT